MPAQPHDLDEVDYLPVLAFDSDDPQFARGYEAGRIDGLLAHLRAAYTQPVCGSNAEMMARIAGRHGRSLRIVEHPDAAGDWITAEFGRPGTAPVTLP